MTTNFERVTTFNEIFDPERLTRTEEQNKALRLKLLEEEVKETTDLLDGTEEFDKAKLAKELSDILYIVYGTAEVFDIDLDKAFKQVHLSNLTKLGSDGKPIFREDGKVLKGPHYQPPNLDWVNEK